MELDEKEELAETEKEESEIRLLETRLSKREQEKELFRQSLQNRICDIMKDKIIWLSDNLAFKSEKDIGKLQNEKQMYTTVINSMIKEGVPNYPMLYMIIDCPPLVLVMEKSSTDFLELLRKSCLTLTEQELHDDIFQIFTAHYFLLQKGYIQGDLKPDNILVDIDSNYTGCYNYQMVYGFNVYLPLYGYLLKLADFGISRKLTSRDDLTYDYKRFLILTRRELIIIGCDDLLPVIDKYYNKLLNLETLYEKIRVKEIGSFLQEMMSPGYMIPESCELIIHK